MRVIKLKNFRFILLIIFTLIFSKETVVIEINSMSDYKLLVQLGIELDHHRTATEVHAYTTPSEIDILQKNGFHVHSIANEAHDYYMLLKEETRGSDDPLREYHNYEELTNFLQDIVSNYPEIASLESIGQSVQGRELWVMRITDNLDEDELEPEFKYVANMHGDETPGREFSLFLIEWLCENYGNNDRATFLVDNTDIYIMPSMNPDGFELGIRNNANGVDLNRDFPDQFNDVSNTMFGRQPETRAIMSWADNHNFTLSANMHSGALVANYPFDGPVSGVYSACPDDEIFIDLALAYSTNHTDMYNSSNYSQGITNGAYWYAVDGGMQDWNYIWEQNFEITLEQSNTKWPNSNAIPGLWNENKESMIVFMEQVHKGAKGLVLDANTGLPIHAMLTIEGIQEPISNHENNGDFYRLLSPGSYEITASSFGYQSLTQSIIVGQNDATEVNFSLYPETFIIENFEEDFVLENWVDGGNNNWNVINGQSADGVYSLKSGDISSNQLSSIEIELDCENGPISFYQKVSCEHFGAQTGNPYDYLAFYIDNVEQKKWAGELEWSYESFDVSAGNHTFKWDFIKDGGVTSGLDCAWIDHITFPKSAQLFGDINNDNDINVLDVIVLINYILDDAYNTSADINSDQTLNVLDIVELINIILD
jgi:hypothetical protein